MAEQTLTRERNLKILINIDWLFNIFLDFDERVIKDPSLVLEAILIRIQIPPILNSIVIIRADTITKVNFIVALIVLAINLSIVHVSRSCEEQALSNHGSISLDLVVGVLGWVEGEPYDGGVMARAGCVVADEGYWFVGVLLLLMRHAALVSHRQ